MGGKHHGCALVAIYVKELGPYLFGGIKMYKRVVNYFCKLYSRWVCIFLYQCSIYVTQVS